MADTTCVDCATQDTVTSTAIKLAEALHDTAGPYDPLNVSTFVPPPSLPVPSITIEFCDRCRWLHRATWVSTELLLTFAPPALKGVHLVPLNAEETAGQFRIWLSMESGPMLVWDRKVEGGFPEMKDLKQRIRDQIQPGKSLGHSDRPK